MNKVDAVTEAVVSPRQRVLDAARRVFARDGYESGSLNDVASAAGMSRHNLLYYFPSKRDLLVAVLEERDLQADARLQWLSSATDRTFMDFLDGLDSLLPTIYQDRELVALYHRLRSEAVSPEHPAHAWIRDRHRAVQGTTGSVLRRAQERGEISSSVDTEGAAIALLGAIEGLEAQWLVDPELDWARAAAALRSMVEGAFKA